ncbi:MAG: 50S ribosomal protein L29 [Thermoprotei archaeon]
MKAQEIRKLSDEELNKRLNEISAELVKLRGLYTAGRPPKNVMYLRSLRKDYARILTILRERQLGITKKEKAKEKPKGSTEKKEKKTDSEVNKN